MSDLRQGVGTEAMLIKTLARRLRNGEDPAYILYLIRTWDYHAHRK